MSARALLEIGSGYQRNQKQPVLIDYWLLFAVLTLAALGLIMLTSASITSAAKHFDNPFYYLIRQSEYLLFGFGMAMIVWRTPLRVWQASSQVLLIVGLLIAALILIPGIGKTVNGSTRWLHLGIVNIQVSELIKLLMIIYFAGYLTRRLDRVRESWQGFLLPVAVLCVVALLLLLEPDFGATVVTFATVVGMFLLAGARLRGFIVLLSFGVMALGALAIAAPYRLKRLTSFLDPWADPFNSGFQLSQSLIAFGRGEWFGVGLGASVQKLFYLPEAHTDFVFAVLAEELGFVGAAFVITLFLIFAWRSFAIGMAAERVSHRFAAYLAYGIGFWLVLQAYINIGVNMGVLPTKGITLPLMSYGGSSIVVTCVAIALLFRADYEARVLQHNPKAMKDGKWQSIS